MQEISLGEFFWIRNSQLCVPFLTQLTTLTCSAMRPKSYSSIVGQIRLQSLYESLQVWITHCTVNCCCLRIRPILHSQSQITLIISQGSHIHAIAGPNGPLQLLLTSRVRQEPIPSHCEIKTSQMQTLLKITQAHHKQHLLQVPFLVFLEIRCFASVRLAFKVFKLSTHPLNWSKS